MAARRRKDVVVEVKKRAQEMGVSASAEELTDLLMQRARLEVRLDRCRLGEGDAGSCRVAQAAMDRVEASFRAKSGLSTREFRGGRRDDPAGAALRQAGPSSPRRAARPASALSTSTARPLDEPLVGP